MSSAIRPGRLVNTTIRDPRNTASSALWVTNTEVRPVSVLTARTSSCNRSRVRASSAANGSSRRNSGFSAASARAMATRCCCPPEISQIRRSAVPSRPTRSSSWSRRPGRSDLATPAYLSARSMLPPTVRQGKRRGCWNTTPAESPGVGARPSTSTRPSVGLSNPAISRRSVLLPHPEAPTRTTNSPAGTSRETGPTAVTVSEPLP